MPGLVMEPRRDIEFMKESFATSPETELDSLDLAIDDIIDTSIEQLYNNVYEMQSSDQSPSRASSFFSFGDESRVDSELRHLVGDIEVTKEVVAETSREEPSPKPSLKSDKTIKGLNLKRRKKLRQRKSSDLGPSLLRRAMDMMSSGDDPERAIEIAQKATKLFEECPGEGRALEVVMCLHVQAALQRGLGRYEDAVELLERAIEMAVSERSERHSLAKFAGCMQLGDTYAMMGRVEDSVLVYEAGVEIQRRAIGEKDPRFAETCRFVAEANVQALRLDEAERLCRIAVEIHKVNGFSAEEASDRRLMGLICDCKGNYEAALEHYALASAAMAPCRGLELEIASVDRSIGDVYSSLLRFDEAVFAYEKALRVFKSWRGENHPDVASVLVRLADLHRKLGHVGESKTCCESALKIYARPNREIPPEEVAGGLVDVSGVYQAMDELDQATKLLKKALRVLGDEPRRRSMAAGVEAQIGVMYYMMGSYKESYEMFKSSVSKFRASADEKKSAVFGVALNQMGLACVHICNINEAAELFEEAKSVLEIEYGLCHTQTLGVYSNLAGTYDAMGRIDDAIKILEYVVRMREENVGTAGPEVDDDKRRLAELLREAGRGRSRKPKSLETLLDTKNAQQAVKLDDGIEVIL